MNDDGTVRDVLVGFAQLRKGDRIRFADHYTACTPPTYTLLEEPYECKPGILGARCEELQLTGIELLPQQGSE